MSYGTDYLNAIIENMDIDSIDMGWFDSVMQTEFTHESYQDAEDFLEGKLSLENVEFNSQLLENTFSSHGWGKTQWQAPYVLFRLFGLDYDDDKVYRNTSILQDYNDSIGLPDEWSEKLEKGSYLENFKENFSKIDVREDYKYYELEKVISIIQNEDYDVNSVEQVGVLANLIYWLSEDKSADFISSAEYKSTEQWNQLAINAEMDKDILDAIEENSSGWYADDESLESQFDKVDMHNYSKDLQKEQMEFKRNNKITQEIVDAWMQEYEGILEFNYKPGKIFLDDQRNDYISVSFNDEVIYSDDGTGNKFGDTALLKTPIESILKERDFKTAKEVFIF